MKKFLAFFLFFSFCAICLLSIFIKGQDSTSSIKENSLGISTSKNNAADIIWSFLPANKESWPEDLLIFWKVTHMKENCLNITSKDNWIKLKDIPPAMRNALISIEDRRFYSHIGVDIDGILRATLVNLQADSVVQGASTITQQLVKNTVLTSEQTMGRKVTEAALSLLVEYQNSKDDILEMYLNTTYFGAGATGIKAASYVYFGVEPFQLSLPESATLAGLPYAPSALNPYKDPKNCTKRRNLVLAQMSKNGFLTTDEAETSSSEPLTLSGNGN